MNRKILRLACAVFGFVAIACSESAIKPGPLAVSSHVQNGDSIHLQAAARTKKKSCCLGTPSRFRTAAPGAKIENRQTHF